MTIVAGRRTDQGDGGARVAACRPCRAAAGLARRSLWWGPPMAMPCCSICGRATATASRAPPAASSSSSASRWSPVAVRLLDRAGPRGLGRHGRGPRQHRGRPPASSVAAWRLFPQLPRDLARRPRGRRDASVRRRRGRRRGAARMSASAVGGRLSRAWRRWLFYATALGAAGAALFVACVGRRHLDGAVRRLAAGLAAVGDRGRGCCVSALPASTSAVCPAVALLTRGALGDRGRHLARGCLGACGARSGLIAGPRTDSARLVAGWVPCSWPRASPSPGTLLRRRRAGSPGLRWACTSCAPPSGSAPSSRCCGASAASAAS